MKARAAFMPSDYHRPRTTAVHPKILPLRIFVQSGHRRIHFLPFGIIANHAFAASGRTSATAAGFLIGFAVIAMSRILPRIWW